MDHNVESPGTGMLRRELLAMLSAYAACAVGRARNTASLEPFFESREGAAILLDVRSRRPIAIHAAAVAGRFLAPPGSTLKPFVLAALLRSGKLTATESLPCPGRLTIAGRSFDCSHPRLDSPMRVETALAYSCNCFVARVAERFAPGELAGELARAGFGEASGRIRPVSSRDDVRLQALGEEGILITAAELARAYRSLALQAGRAEIQPIVAGLEGAVEYGTGQRAQVPGVKVAGKTGSVRTESGAPIAWFAGFLPSRAPEVVVAVMLQGHSGGSDAAPVAGRILEAYRAGRL
jgi:cell division protein FtsI/penicillin-binding protein 2